MSEEEPKTGAEIDSKIAAAVDAAKVPDPPKDPPKEKIEKKTCGRCGAPMEKNLKKSIWECTKCGYDEAF